MAGNPTPRQMVKDLLQGVLPPRPLLVPIMFSLGARLENLPLRSFLANPTKISTSLKLIRGNRPMDGVSCYFDALLEMEALGGVPQWDAEDKPPTMCWPDGATKGELPQGLRSPEDAAKSTKVQVAVEVIRRLKSLLPGEPALMAGVAGPFTIAARLTQLDCEKTPRVEDLPVAALELAGAVITKISAAFVEAGANLIFVQEEILPALTSEDCEAWASLLRPAFNVIRFYEALPVLQLANGRAFRENSGVILQRQWDGVVCPALEGIAGGVPQDMHVSQSAGLGIALPLEAFSADEVRNEELGRNLRTVVSELRPVILTTVGDVHSTEDLKRLMTVLDRVPRAIQP